MCRSATLCSDISCWVSLLPHEVSSHGNPFIENTQTCTHTHQHSSYSLVTLSKRRQTILLAMQHPQHLFPLSTLSCSPAKRQKPMKKTKGIEDDGQRLPDILRIEIKTLIVDLFSAETHRVLVKKLDKRGCAGKNIVHRL